MSLPLGWNATEVQSLRQALYQLLVPVFDHQDVENYYLNTAAMAWWLRAFTDSTVDPVNNLENLEYLGDMTLKYAFAIYLMETYPDITESQRSELNAYYMSKEYQLEFVKKMNLSRFVKIAEDLRSRGVVGDVFESFFGALHTVSDLYILGLGATNCKDYLRYLFKDITIDMDKSYGAAKTQIEQLFKRFSVGEPLKEVKVMNGRIVTQIYLNEKQVGILDSILTVHGKPGIIDRVYNSPGAIKVFSRQEVYNFSDGSKSKRKPIPDERYLLIGQAIQDSYAASEFQAYQSALTVIRDKIGVTRPMVISAKSAFDIRDLGLPEQTLQRLRQRQTRDDLDLIVFENKQKLSTGKKGTVIQLVGLRKTSSGNYQPVRILASTKVEDYSKKRETAEEKEEYDNLRREVRVQLIDTYLNM